MKISFINYYYEAGFDTFEQLLTRYTSLVGWAQALVSVGAQVSVFQRFHTDLRHSFPDVSCHFISDRYGPGFQRRQIPLRFHRVVAAQIKKYVRSGKPSVVHLNGLIFPLQLAHLRQKLPSQTPIMVQHHAEKPHTGWRKWFQRFGLAAADGFMFSALQLSLPWLQSGLIPAHKRVYQVMEGSTEFYAQDRSSARQSTGLKGSPVCLWVGRLDSNKDPLTVLAGIKQALPYIPGLKLYMIYHTEDFLPEIQALLMDDPGLMDAVSLVGFVPHSQIEDYYNSADYFVLGSHYEGSGYALVEALACGVIPIVTDIPSFRRMTHQGQIGALWPVGDPAALAAALKSINNSGLRSPSKPVLDFFKRELSYPAIASQALAAYQDIWEMRT